MCGLLQDRKGGHHVRDIGGASEAPLRFTGSPSSIPFRSSEYAGRPLGKHLLAEVAYCGGIVFVALATIWATTPLIRRKGSKVLVVGDHHLGVKMDLIFAVFSISRMIRLFSLPTVYRKPLLP